MRNTYESGIVLQAEGSKEPVVTTNIGNGEAIIIDDGFVFAYKRAEETRRPGSKKAKLVLMKHKDVPLAIGANKGALIPYVRPEGFSQEIDHISIKPNPSHSTIVIGEHEFHVREQRGIYYGYVLEIESPTQFGFESLGQTTRTSDMHAILEQRLGISRKIEPFVREVI